MIYLNLLNHVQEGTEPQYMIYLFYKNDMKNHEVYILWDFPFILSKIETPIIIIAQTQLLLCCTEDKENPSNSEDVWKIKYIRYKTLEILKVGTWKARQYILLGMMSVCFLFHLFNFFFFFFSPFESKQTSPVTSCVCKFGNYFPAIICKVITVKGQRWYQK